MTIYALHMNCAILIAFLRIIEYLDFHQRFNCAPYTMLFNIIYNCISASCKRSAARHSGGSRPSSFCNYVSIHPRKNGETMSRPRRVHIEAERERRVSPSPKSLAETHLRDTLQTQRAVGAPFTPSWLEYPTGVDSVVVVVGVSVAIRVARQKERWKTSDKRWSRVPSVLERSPPIYLAKKTTSNEKEETKEELREGVRRDGRGCRLNKIRASRRSQVENVGEKKNPYRRYTGAAPGGGARYTSREGCRRLPFDVAHGGRKW